MNLAALLQRAGRADHCRPALLKGTSTVASYAEVARDAATLAGGLGEVLGLAVGDRVALVMKNVPEYVTALFGAWWGGFVAVPVNAKLHPKEFEYILDDSGARVCFVTPDIAASLNSVAAVADGRVQVIEVGSAEWRGRADRAHRRDDGGGRVGGRLPRSAKFWTRRSGPHRRNVRSYLN